MAVINKPMAWSFSVLEAFETCPLQLKETRLTKRFSDRNRWNVAGTSDHEHFENFIKHGTPLPLVLRPYEEALSKLVQSFPGQITTEAEVCLTKSWMPTGWFAKNAWVRAKMDLLVADTQSGTATYFDWKFGKRRKDSRWLQLKITAVLLNALYAAQGVPMHKFRMGLVWVPDGFDIEPMIVDADSIPAIHDEVMEKVEEYQIAYEQDFFPPKKNGLCKRHCPVTTCRFHGD